MPTSVLVFCIQSPSRARTDRILIGGVGGLEFVCPLRLRMPAEGAPIRDTLTSQETPHA